MKTETQIAQEKIGLYKKGLVMKEDLIPLREKDQRFLEFLETFRYFKTNTDNLLRFSDKKSDLKQAIKLYEDVGI